MEVSLRYTPVAGGLHTRYAPVRRSPAAHCCAPLPLDLHVLGLPLAFILSQDQTLHCKNCSRNLLTRLVSEPRAFTRSPRHTLSLWSQCFNVLCLRRGALGQTPVFLESGCKDTTIFQTAKFFFQFFLSLRRNAHWHSDKNFKLFFTRQEKAPAKRPPKARFSQK